MSTEESQAEAVPNTTDTVTAGDTNETPSTNHHPQDDTKRNISDQGGNNNHVVVPLSNPVPVVHLPEVPDPVAVADGGGVAVPDPVPAPVVPVVEEDNTAGVVVVQAPPEQQEEEVVPQWLPNVELDVAASLSVSLHHPAAAGNGGASGEQVVQQQAHLGAINIPDHIDNNATVTTNTEPTTVDPSNDATTPSPATNGSTPGATKSIRKDFNYRLKELQKYKQKHGDCMVPHKYSENPSLGTWVDTQRRRYRVFQRNRTHPAKSENAAPAPATTPTTTSSSSGTMTEEHVQKLLAIGFVFEPRLTRAETWNKRLAQLQHYHSVHRHCNVREDDTSNPGLGKWVSYVRRQYRLQKSGRREKGRRLTEERINQLLELGFIFELKEAQANKRFQDGIEFLRNFYAERGHVNVPKIYVESPTLGLCVEEMRKVYRKICGGGEEGNLYGMERGIVLDLVSMGFLAEEGLTPPQWLVDGTQVLQVGLGTAIALDAAAAAVAAVATAGAPAVTGEGVVSGGGMGGNPPSASLEQNQQILQEEYDTVMET